MWWGGPSLHLQYLFFCSIFVFQLSGIVCANYAQLPSPSLRTVPDKREKNDAVVSEMFLAWFSLFSKNGFERAINKNREKKTNNTTFFSQKDSMKLLLSIPSISLEPLKIWLTCKREVILYRRTAWSSAIPPMIYRAPYITSPSRHSNSCHFLLNKKCVFARHRSHSSDRGMPDLMTVFTIFNANLSSYKPSYQLENLRV